MSSARPGFAFRIPTLLVLALACFACRSVEPVTYPAKRAAVYDLSSIGAETAAVVDFTGVGPSEKTAAGRLSSKAVACLKNSGADAIDLSGNIKAKIAEAHEQNALSPELFANELRQGGLQIPKAYLTGTVTRVEANDQLVTQEPYVETNYITGAQIQGIEYTRHGTAQVQVDIRMTSVESGLFLIVESLEAKAANTIKTRDALPPPVDTASLIAECEKQIVSQLESLICDHECNMKVTIFITTGANEIGKSGWGFDQEVPEFRAGQEQLKRPDYEAAMQFFEQATERFRQSSNLAGLARGLHNIATTYHLQGKYEEALAFYDEAGDTQVLDQTIEQERLCQEDANNRTRLALKSAQATAAQP